jgi:hypothetical protein
VIQDAFLEVKRGAPDSEARAAEAFLGALANVYPKLERPQFEYYDWPTAARRSLRALNTKSGCCRRVNGKLYVQAYVGCDQKPPESMVQGALAVPLMEYEAWRGRAVPLLAKLATVRRASTTRDFAHRFAGWLEPISKGQSEVRRNSTF